MHPGFVADYWLLQRRVSGLFAYVYRSICDRKPRANRGSQAQPRVRSCHSSARFDSQHHREILRYSLYCSTTSSEYAGMFTVHSLLVGSTRRSCKEQPLVSRAVNRTIVMDSEYASYLVPSIGILVLYIFGCFTWPAVVCSLGARVGNGEVRG